MILKQRLKLTIVILDLNEVMNAFQTLIVGMGYSNDSLKHWVLEKADEYKDENDADVEPVYDGAGFTFEDNFRSHFVSNRRS